MQTAATLYTVSPGGQLKHAGVPVEGGTRVVFVASFTVRGAPRPVDDQKEYVES